MEFLDKISFLYTGFAALVDWRYVVMWLIGGILIYLAIKKDMEPTLLLPLGFGTILVNIPFSGAVGDAGALTTLFKAGISNELFPLILFIGIGAMIDFTPLLANPKLRSSEQPLSSGIFFTLCLASMFFRSTTQRQSVLSVRQTARRPLSWHRRLIRSLPAQLWLRRIRIWRLYRSSSHRSSKCSLPRKSVLSVCRMPIPRFRALPNPFPDCHYYHRRYCRSRIGFSYRLLDVR